jgi:hypothetical protein
MSAFFELVQVSTSLSSLSHTVQSLPVDIGRAGNGEGFEIGLLACDLRSRSLIPGKHDPARSNSGTMSIGHYAGSTLILWLPFFLDPRCRFSPHSISVSVHWSADFGESGDYFHNTVYLKVRPHMSGVCMHCLRIGGRQASFLGATIDVGTTKKQ